MKIIYNPLKENQKSDISYWIKNTDDSVTIGFNTKYENITVDKSATINFADYKGRVVQITLQTIWEPGTVCISPMYEMSSRYMEIQNKKNDAVTIARVFVPNKEEDVLVLLEQSCNYTQPFDAVGIECVEFDKNKITKSGIMQSLSPEFLEITKRHEQKQHIISRIDIYNSITYLESQVDALTSLVLNLVQNATLTDEERTKACNVLTEAKKYSVLDIKDIDKVLKEIDIDKNAVREMQKELYAKE